MTDMGNRQLALKTTGLLQTKTTRRFSINTWAFPLITSLTLLVPTVLYWSHERSVSAEFQQSRLAQFRLRLSKRIEEEIDGQLRPVRRLADEIRMGDVSSAQAFTGSARSILREEPSLKYLTWITRDGKCISSTPPEANSPGKASGSWLMALLADAPKGVLALGESSVAANMADRVIVLPVIDDGVGDGRDEKLDGAIVTCETTRAMFGTMLPPDVSAPFIVEVKDENHRILFASDGAKTPEAQALLRAADVDQIPVLDRSWSMSVAAAPAGLGRRPSGNAGAFLLSGLIVSLLGGATVAQAARHRRSEMHRTLDHLAALEALHSAAAAISCKPRSEGEVFERLLAAACDLLRMPIALLLELEGGRRVRLARQSGFNPPVQWEHLAISELPMVDRCAQTGEILTVESADADTSSPKYAAMRRRNVKSMLVLPLVAGEDRIGVLALCDESPRKFSEEDLRLARLWASQAAVTLANHRLAAANDEALIQQQRLNQQVRHDADLKAILLRELNHRVKNNLAGIVGLLSAGVPELSEQAQQWLDRAIVRIETLARAHELFVGTSSELGLGDLIRKTIEPIAAIKPADVRITLDLSVVNDPLNTDQAITLAMVVHELVTNALQHGVAERGEVRVSSAQSRPGWVMIQIIDDGTGELLRHGGSDGPGRESGLTAVLIRTGRGTGTGIGLQLVRGLVGRELHGTFTMVENVDGGSVATVEFPVDSGALPPMH